MKILIISSDPVGKQMAGLGIRNYQIAKELSEKTKHYITLAVPNKANIENENFRLVTYRNNFEKFRLIWDHQLIISQGFGLAGIIFYLSKKKFLLDFYDPINLEWLETAKEEKNVTYESRNRFNRDYLNVQLKLANFIVCANRSQLGLWLGMLFSLGRIKGSFYKSDPFLKQIIDIAPFPLRDYEPKRTKKVLRGVVKGIGEKDKILIWNGGVWNWFDPVTLIRAMAEISKRRQDIKLYFLGTKHPNPNVKEFRSLNEAHKIASEKGLLGKFVFFNFGWVDYQLSGEFLMEADIAISTYFDTLETMFSNRTRFLDALWAQLPLICTKGDNLSGLIEKEGWGISVVERDQKALIQAIEKLVDDREFYDRCKDNLQNAKNHFSAEVSLSPIVNYCLNPEAYPLKRNFLYVFKLFPMYFRRTKLRFFGSY